MRRPFLALLTSLALHGLAVAAAGGWFLWQGFSRPPPVEFELVSAVHGPVDDLPLGPPPPRGSPRGGTSSGRPRRPKAKPGLPGSVAVVQDGGTTASPPADAGADGPTGDSGPNGPSKRGDLRAYGPEGSRVTALLRLDRLRQTPEAAAYIAGADKLLQRLPDRHRLIDGTGLDLYRDFDVLLVATPDPRDDAVTFLAARHHLPEEVLRAGLDRGAQLMGRPLEWTEQGGRPVGIRRVPRTAPGQVAAPLERDDRVLVLPAPGLAVMATPAYARLLIPARGAGAPGHPAAAWTRLAARLEAEHDAMPENAVLMMTATNLLQNLGTVVPGTRGSVDDDAVRTVPTAPQSLTLVVGLDPAPTIELTGQFATAAAAQEWEARWPALKQKLLGNPLVLLAGLTAIVERTRAEVEGDSLTLHTSTTALDAQRLLMMLATFAGGLR